MTERQWRFWEDRNKKALVALYGPKRAKREFEKLREKTRRNNARINSCKLHNFNWKKSIADAKERRDKWPKEKPMPATMMADIYCRCKNCGGRISVAYAGPYMEAVEHMKKLRKEGNGGEVSGVQRPMPL